MNEYGSGGLVNEKEKRIRKRETGRGCGGRKRPTEKNIPCMNRPMYSPAVDGRLLLPFPSWPIDQLTPFYLLRVL